MAAIGAQKMRDIADHVKAQLPEGIGFAVLVFQFGGGPAGYFTNANRATMVKALREQADRLEQRHEFPTPEEN